MFFNTIFRNVPFLVLVLILMFRESQSSQKVDQSLLTDLHNWYRAAFTRYQQVAADMSAVDWDEYLTLKAEVLAIKCMNWTRESLLTSEKYFDQIGIVILSKPNDDNQSLDDFLKKTFEVWINSSTTLKSGCNGNSIICDNIKQIFYSRTDKIGCAKNLCHDNKVLKVVCLYNNKFTKQHSIFQPGEPCTSCQGHQPFCLDGSLCASWNQCQRKNVNSNCSRIFKNEDNLRETLDDIMLDDSNRCVDSNPNCPEWKNQNFCHKDYVQQQCLQSCQMCSNSGNYIICYESSRRKSACLRVKNLNLCRAPDMQKICPITCTNTKCHKSLQRSAASGSKADQQSEPPQCALMVSICDHPDVLILCRKTCASKLRKSTKSHSISIEPKICKLLKRSCMNPAISMVCKLTCASTTSLTSSPSLLPITTELKQCPLMKDICHIPNVAKWCQKTCNFIKTISPTSTTTTTIQHSSESFKKQLICQSLKELCNYPQVARMCMKTCARRSSTSPSSETIEPTQCLLMADLCANPYVSNLCKKTCALSSTLKSSRRTVSKSVTIIHEPSSCISMKTLCSNIIVANMCKKTCKSSTTSKISTSISTISTISDFLSTSLPIISEPNFCFRLQRFCAKPEVNTICKKTCRASSTRKKSTRHSTISSTSDSAKSTLQFISDPTFCLSMKHLCFDGVVSNMCRKTCASSSTSISSTTGLSTSPTSDFSKSSTDSTTTEPSLCLSMKQFCMNPPVAQMCKKTCEFSTTSKALDITYSMSSTARSSTSITSTTEIIEPKQCLLMKDLCVNPSVSNMCKKTCGRSSFTKSSSSSIRNQSEPLRIINEPAFCSTMKESCKDYDVANLCRKTCKFQIKLGSSTNSKLDSSKLTTTTTKSSSSLKLSTKNSTISSASDRSTSSFQSSIEPTSCPSMKELCDDLNVKFMCKKTCGTSSNGAYSSSTSVYGRSSNIIEPSICPSLRHRCDNHAIYFMCKKSCGIFSAISTTSKTPILSSSKSSKSYSIFIYEPVECLEMKPMCSNPNVATLCKKTCAIIQISTSSSTISSTMTIEPTMCPSLKVLCVNPTVYIMCKKTCASSTGSSTSLKSSSPTSSNPSSTSKTKKSSTKSLISESPKSTTSLTIEPPVCLEMKDSCQDPGIFRMCKKTCGTRRTKLLIIGPSTTSKLLTNEPPMCSDLKHFCSDPHIFKMCIQSCASTITIVSTSTLSSTLKSTIPSTILTVEPSMCPKLKDLCINPSVSGICKRTCASRTTIKFKYSTNPSTTLSETLSSEPTICLSLRKLCQSHKVRNICKHTCGLLAINELYK